MTLSNFVGGLAVSAVTAFFGLLIRNDSVQRYRQDLLMRVGAAADLDIYLDRPYLWRIEAFLAVPYKTMVYRFWRRLDSFYPNMDFATPGAMETIHG